MWKWIIKAAVALGKSEWARAQARKLIEKLRRRSENAVHAVATAAAIGVPPADAVRQSRIVKTRFDTLKPGQVTIVDGQRFRVSRLLSSSATETVYEADLV